MHEDTFLRRIASARSGPESADPGPWLQAAAVLDTFLPDELQPLGAHTGTPQSLSNWARRLVSGRMRLHDGARAVQLRKLFAQDKLVEARLANEVPMSLRQQYLDKWLSGNEVDWQKLKAPQLRAALQVLRWVQAVPDPKRPQLAELQGRLRRLERREPLETIARGFLNRDEQTRRLERFVDETGHPLMIYGIGGSGKSALLAEFLLRMDKRDDVTWVYIDLEALVTDYARPAPVVEEVVRQIGEQRPEFIRVTRASLEGLESQVAIKGQTEVIGFELDDYATSELIESVTELGPLVIAIDTFERAQIQGPSVAQQLVGGVQQLIADHEKARLVISGRVPVSGFEELEVAGLSDDDALALIRSQVSADVSDSVIKRLANRFGKMPLTLLLTADALKRLDEDGSDLMHDIDKLGDAVAEEQIQGFLYMRLLGHLSPGLSNAAEVRRLAHASLALPAFDERLLGEVLGAMCGVTPDRASECFEALRSEVAFVETVLGDEHWLRHRADLRERVLPFLDQSLALDKELKDRGTTVAALLRNAHEQIRARGDEISPTVRRLFDEHDVGREIQQEGLIDRAIGLLATGRARETIELINAAPDVRRTAEGISLAARAYHALGDFDRARLEARRCTHAALTEGDVEMAVIMAEWAADFLNAADIAGPILQRADSRGRQRLLAAEQARIRRTGDKRSVLSELDEAWQAVHSDVRSADPVLTTRLAGLLGHQNHRAVLEALEAVGLPDLRYEDKRHLAYALQTLDAQLSNSPDSSGSIADILELDSYLNESDDDGAESDAWLRAFSAHVGTDAGPLFRKIIYVLWDNNDVNTFQPLVRALADFYAERDERRLLSTLPKSIEVDYDDVVIPNDLTPWQLNSIGNLVTSSFTPTEFRLIVEERVPEMRELVSFDEDHKTLVHHILSEAYANGLASKLVGALSHASGSKGFDQLLRASLVRKSWSDETSPMHLESLLETGAVGEAEALVRNFIEDVERTARRVPEGVARKLLGTLRAYRLFSSLEEASYTVCKHDPDNIGARRQYAQALIEQGRMTAAIRELSNLKEELSRDSGADYDSHQREFELTEVEGLLGRAYRQLYINAQPNEVELRTYDLEKAVGYYLGAYETNPGNYWHGINAVALLNRASQVNPADEDARHISQRIARQILETLRDKTAVWELATRMEAHLALGQKAGAIETCRQYLNHPDLNRFNLMGTMRQLEQVWLLSDDESPGDQLLPIMRVRLAQMPGGGLTIHRHDLAWLRRNEDRLGKTWGDAEFRPIPWLRSTLHNAKCVARIGPDEHQPIGTGVLLNGAWIDASFGDLPMLLTCAHLFEMEDSAHDVGLLTAEQAIVVFPLTTEPAVLKVSRVVYVSRELDFILLELSEAPFDLRETRAADPSESFVVRPGDHLHILGQSPGAGSQVTVQDNLVRDVGRNHLWYVNPTDTGSSGSPVFDSHGRVVGLHRNHSAVRKAGVGIRIDRILGVL